VQQHAPLSLAESSIFVAHSQPDVNIANVANLIDVPGARTAQQLPSAQVPIISNARSSSFSYFANRGPVNQVGGQVRSQPTGLVAIKHATSNASNNEIEEEEPERQELRSAYDVNVRASHDEIKERQDLCSVYDVDVHTSDVFDCALLRRIHDRCAANTIQLANDDDVIAALQIQTSELELHVYEGQEQVNGLVYATYDQI